MKNFMIVVLMFCGWMAQGQDDQGAVEKKITPFIAYDFGEAAFNKFKSISGEVGVQFANDHLLRLVHMNIHLTEQHLSSSFAGAIDGPDVEGRFLGVEAFYDLPAFTNGLYIGPSIGYYKTSYDHLILSQSFEKQTATVGLGLSYQETDILGVDGLYFRFSIPMRISLNASEESLLGETVIKNDRFGNNIWMFIGYRF